jgi:hypothetical protein
MGKWTNLHSRRIYQMNHHSTTKYGVFIEFIKSSTCRALGAGRWTHDDVFLVTVNCETACWFDVVLCRRRPLAAFSAVVFVGTASPQSSVLTPWALSPVGVRAFGSFWMSLG